MTRKNEAGQALIFTVVALGILLMGFAGLGIDMGYLRYEKRLQQSAADAAAIAGASNLLFAGVLTGAQNAATANGFTDASSNTLSTCNGNDSHSATLLGKICVQVNIGPTSGPHSGDASYVEVYVAEVQPTFFMRVLGIKTETVTARAVATNLSGVNLSCFYLMGSPGLAISGGGNGGIQAPSCGFLDDGTFDTGTSANWLMNVGSAGTTASSAGGKDNVTCSSGQSACPALSIPAAANPLADLATPPVGTAKKWANGDGPGTYNGMSFGGNTSVNLPSGVYVLSGGSFSCGGNSTITGTGVMFYLTNGATWDCSGTPSVNLTAPSASNCGSCSSQYYGILIYQDPNDQNANTMGGTSTYTLNGLVVIWSLNMKGTDTLTLGGTSGYGMTAIKTAVLVE